MKRGCVPRTAQSSRSVFDAALLRELGRSWAELNRSHFDAALAPPAIQLSDARRRLGSWHRLTRTLTLSRPLMLERSWGMVLEVLRHEMAHQYVDEVLGVHDQTAHGPQFRRVCEDRAIDARAAGAPLDLGSHKTPAILRKIHALLALADSPNRHEAEAAMRTAHKLMRRYNVDAAPGQYSFRHVGTPTRRIPGHEKILAGILGQHFFVQPIWAFAWRPKQLDRARVLEICGRQENLEIAAHVHGFVLETAERMWRDHRRATGLPGNRDRRAFLQGVMMGFNEQLDQQAEACEEAGLIWIGDAGLEDFLGRRHPRQLSSRARRAVHGPAYSAGKHAGRKLVIRRPVSASEQARGRRLRG
jgi:hypothetical protein